MHTRSLLQYSCWRRLLDTGGRACVGLTTLMWIPLAGRSSRNYFLTSTSLIHWELTRRLGSYCRRWSSCPYQSMSRSLSHSWGLLHILCTLRSGRQEDLREGLGQTLGRPWEFSIAYQAKIVRRAEIFTKHNVSVNINEVTENSHGSSEKRTWGRGNLRDIKNQTSLSLSPLISSNELKTSRTTSLCNSSAPFFYVLSQIEKPKTFGQF